MRSFAIITTIALTGVLMTNMLNRSQNQHEIQQKAMNAVYLQVNDNRLNFNSDKEQSL